MSARDAILDAAADLATNKGVQGLSVESVIQAAEVSKGAFFYHFKTKEDMLAALVRHVSSEFVAALDKDVAHGKSFSAALVDASLRQVAERGPLIASLIAAVSLDPSLRSHVRSQVDGWTQAMIEVDGLPHDRAELIRLTLDGLMISTLLYEPVVQKARLQRARGLLDHLVSNTAL